MAPTQSVWEDTKTFFPIFLSVLGRRSVRTAYVVGASDGKFVLPLARQGIRVIAIERDQTALDGGPATLPGPVEGTTPGLRKRLAEEGLSGLVEIVRADLLDVADEMSPADAVWTSCSWHYSINHRRSVADFIHAMAGLCRPRGGVLGAEYMMPVEPRHFAVEHYLTEGRAPWYFPGWQVDWETYTPPFVEAPHVEQLAEHIHRMGLIIATRP
jgi:SAM-dependent methyltransferase